MKRSTLFIFLSLILLSILAVYLLKSSSNVSSGKNADRNFLVKDTSLVTRIFMADKEGNQSEVTREKEGWIVNQKYPCRSEAILNLLEAIRLVEVKMPVPKTGKENVIRFMSSNAIKVEIYSGNKKLKQYYIGHEPADSEGSYMILSDEDGDNYPDPYVCFIPGFKGYLQPRFITRENEWRDRTVLNFTPPELKSIQLNYKDQSKDSSFKIEVISQKSFKLFNHAGEELNYDMGKMRQYLIYFQNISYESLISSKNSHLLDSLSSTKPFAELEIVTTNNHTNKYRFFRKAFNGSFNPELGDSFDFDPDRLFMNFDDNKEWALIQYFVFGKLLITTPYFQNQPTVKK